jgi:predicted transglutaminase-like cysteine proteinase
MVSANKIVIPLAAMLSVIFCVNSGHASAAFSGLPMAPKPPFDRIVLDVPTLPPLAHSVFCVGYPEDCQVTKIAFRGRKLELTPQRWKDLVEVNANVNRSIMPEHNPLGLAGEKWLVSPETGDCNDYTVTKRHELLARGWPSRTLLLAEVVTHWGEHHLVLVIRAMEGDYVLDNLNANIRPWSKVPYKWVRIESPQNPKWWSTVRSIGV